MVDWLMEAFSGVGLQDVRAYETPDGSKAVCGHASGPPGAPAVLLYFHHDVQPPLDEPRLDLARLGADRARTGAGTGAARPTARATSPCTSPPCVRWAPTCR